jgi:hypothetical protein
VARVQVLNTVGVYFIGGGVLRCSSTRSSSTRSSATRTKMVDKNKPSYPSLMSAILSSSPRSLLVHPYLWSAQHLAILHCTFADVDVTHRIIAPVSSPTGPTGLPREGYLYRNDPDSVLTSGSHFSDYIGEILDLTCLGFSGRKR